MSTTPNAALAALNRLRGGAASTPAPTPPPKPATTAPKAVSPLDALKALRASGASAEMGSSDTAAPAAGIAAPTQLPVATPEERNSEDENKFLANLGLEDQGKSLVLPPDAPPDTRMSEEAKAAAAAAPASAPAAEAEAEAPKKARRPSNYKAKLEALGWNEDQIAGMEPARMREVIDGQVRAGDAWSELEAAGGLAAAQAAEGAPAAEPSFPDIDSETQTPPPVATEVATEVAAPAALPAPGLVVYVDCAPVKGADVENAVHLEDMVRPYMEEAAKMNEVSYYNLIEYGKGPSYIAAFVLANPPQGVILANTRYPSTGAVLEVLLPMADVVVRAAR